MKEKIILLTPVYNDWKSLSKLLIKINNIFDKKLKSKFELIIINDCSKEKYNFSINLNGNDTKITSKNDLLYAESEVKEGEILFYIEKIPQIVSNLFT